MRGFRMIIAVVGVVVCEFEELRERLHCFLNGFYSPMVSAKLDIILLMTQGRSKIMTTSSTLYIIFIIDTTSLEVIARL